MEEAILKQMVTIYCKKHHKDSLCPDCAALYQYATKRNETCPRKAEKTFCSSCPIHCYAPKMRAQMKKVMGYAGPRMLFYAPGLVFAHILDSLKKRRKKHNTTKP